MKRAPISPSLLFFFLAFSMLTLLWYFFPADTAKTMAWLYALNIVTLLYYAYDKAASKRSWLRIPEIILHFLAFFGASPAALFSQYFFHHKKTKRSFQKVFRFTVLLQLLLLWYFKSYLL